ncbi:MAG: alpha-glucoside transport system substrate-binding protein [Gaiellaceae bacterium]|jgi:ABC-type glycerol-3-phosphate transport system substrate-binding protein|nr:alpha-glucoside transport system substrate-binding protein [Gaiellaceae bacterium]MDX6478614.1 alpha-glucoside transport system substrate-binding protein [Gaiellaceae bacterium]MDX6489551.1 alpha-glucoside transport system substrate-binding protein [Gaiellaceae bacterium]
MSKRGWFVLTAIALGLSLVAAGCGGSKKSSGGGGTTAAPQVKGTISMVAVWTGAEGAAIQAVLNGFKAKNPGVTIKYKSAKDPGQVITTAVQGGNPPDIAALPSPGLMKGFVSQGALKPIDFAKSDISANFSADWLKFGTVNGKLYGLFFKGANKSTVWYNVHAFKDAGVTPPKEWSELLGDAKTISASGTPAYSIGGADGWTLTDLFENIYLRKAGAAKYDQLSDHKIPWTDPSVKDALKEMGQVLSDSKNINGGSSGALQTNFPDSVTAVFTNPPKAAMIFEGDFVPGVVAGQSKAKPVTDYNVFPFPAVDGKGGDFVVGGGDVIVMFKDNPATQALVKYLATPEAASIWAKRGGFSSPNKNVDPSVYPDAITRTTATALAKATTFRFDMSDLAPAKFGGDAEFTDLQNFLKNPSDVNGAAAKLEKDAKAAYKAGG